jgi:hypothetical protein
MTQAKEPSYIAPENLYTLRGFQVASGVSATRIREARRLGITLPSLLVGKRKFVRGIDAITFIERLAENAGLN